MDVVDNGLTGAEKITGHFIRFVRMLLERLLSAPY
jgi:hypothetical protein